MKRKIALDRKEIRQAAYEEFCSIGLYGKRAVLKVSSLAEAAHYTETYNGDLISMGVDMSTANFERAIDFFLEQADMFISRNIPDDEAMLFLYALPITVGDWRRDKDFWSSLKNRDFFLDPETKSELRTAADDDEMDYFCNSALICNWMIRRTDGEIFLESSPTVIDRKES